jgi:hypothetical protein
LTEAGHKVYFHIQFLLLSFDLTAPDCWLESSTTSASCWNPCMCQLYTLRTARL